MIINEEMFLDKPVKLICSIISQFKFHISIFNKKYLNK